MARIKREVGQLAYYRTEVDIQVEGPLYGSSPTTRQGIEAMLKTNQPSEAQMEYRAGLGMEELKPMDELASEVAIATRAYTEGEKSPSTVFRRDDKGAYVHSNYFKGHLRECGEIVGRVTNMWGLKDLVTRTVLVCPEKLYLGETKVEKTYFTPEVNIRGIPIKQPTEKTVEYVVDPHLKWVLYIASDPRWDEELMEELLTQGSMRGLGPGRAVDASKYTFTMSPWEKLNRLEAREQYRREFKGECRRAAVSNA
jgi:hypothetical protein